MTDCAEHPLTHLRERNLPCGHPKSLLLVSAETGAPLYCELCDCQSARRDAEACEAALREELKAIKSRYLWLRDKANQNTAYDRYGNGGHWSIGFFSEDNRLSFDAAVDAAMAKGKF